MPANGQSVRSRCLAPNPPLVVDATHVLQRSWCSHQQLRPARLSWTPAAHHDRFPEDVGNHRHHTRHRAHLFPESTARRRGWSVCHHQPDWSVRVRSIQHSPGVARQASRHCAFQHIPRGGMEPRGGGRLKSGTAGPSDVGQDPPLAKALACSDLGVAEASVYQVSTGDRRWVGTSGRQ